MREPDDEPRGVPATIIRLAIIAECAITRCALRDLCAALPSVRIVGEFSSTRDALEALDHVRPAAVLLGSAVPIANCLSFRRDLERFAHRPTLIAIRIRPSREMLLELVEHGILGILDEQADEQELALALAVVASGHPFLSANVRALLGAAQPIEPSAELSSLTAREREVLARVIAGEANDGIARQLHISVKTVETHLSHIYGKLGVYSRVQAVVRAQELGLLVTPVTPVPRTHRR